MGAHGAAIGLTVGLSVVLVSLTIGLVMGATAGYFGGRFDFLLMRVIDVLLAFPGILLAIYIAAVLPPSLTNVILALSATGWVGYARLVRGQVLQVREMEYVQACRAMGMRSPRIILRHILPNIAGPVLVHGSFGLGGAILGEAALSFLGLGVAPGTPSWGALLDDGAQYLLVAPHLAVAPGLAILIAVLSFNFLGDGLPIIWMSARELFSSARDAHTRDRLRRHAPSTSGHGSIRARRRDPVPPQHRVA